MSQQMIHCLTATTTYNAPVNEIKVPESQDISREDPIPSGCPNKERDMPRCLTFQIPFQGKAMEEEPCNL